MDMLNISNNQGCVCTTGEGNMFSQWSMNMGPVKLLDHEKTGTSVGKLESYQHDTFSLISFVTVPK